MPTFSRMMSLGLMATVILFTGVLHAQITVERLGKGNTAGKPFEDHNGHKLLFVAITTKCAHNAADFEKAFLLGVKAWQDAGKSAYTTEDKDDNQDQPLVGGERVVLGVKNLTTGSMYWVGVTVTSKTTSKAVTSNDQVSSGGGFHHFKVDFNGRIVMIGVADNDRGGIVWRFDDN